MKKFKKLIAFVPILALFCSFAACSLRVTGTEEQLKKFITTTLTLPDKAYMEAAAQDLKASLEEASENELVSIEPVAVAVWFEENYKDIVAADQLDPASSKLFNSVITPQITADIHEGLSSELKDIVLTKNEENDRIYTFEAKAKLDYKGATAECGLKGRIQLNSQDKIDFVDLTSCYSEAELAALFPEMRS